MKGSDNPWLKSTHCWWSTRCFIARYIQNTCSEADKMLGHMAMNPNYQKWYWDHMPSQDFDTHSTQPFWPHTPGRATTRRKHRFEFETVVAQARKLCEASKTLYANNCNCKLLHKNKLNCNTIFRTHTALDKCAQTEIAPCPAEFECIWGISSTTPGRDARARLQPCAQARLWAPPLGSPKQTWAQTTRWEPRWFGNRKEDPPECVPAK